ncbi:N-acetylglutamate synthase [Delitschia confertaspora ATCC 74209]|uniref:Amino-acid acetyltransferase, mitochondrial n=1 Tax=Delitschia confertaspora ATCC 74209 TaxID=1513339 RepID=A0A9P4MS79_9PLEO|nr:N-acetylglutamate synthase [Delitschia confertaspora ATCC 74209]
MRICGKAQRRGFGGSLLRARNYNNSFISHELTLSSSFSTTPPTAFPETQPLRSSRLSYAKERQRAERDQLIKSLKESPGKRDARNFLKHFDTPKKTDPITPPKIEQAVSDAVGQAHYNAWRLNKTGVNLGNLYTPARSIKESPVFTKQPLTDNVVPENVDPLHIALVKLREPQTLDDETLGGIALTLSQMVRLGLNIALVVDCDEENAPEKLDITPAWEDTVREQSARIVEALEELNDAGAFVVDQALSYAEVDKIDPEIPSSAPVKGRVEVRNQELLFQPLSEGIVPVIPPIAYNAEFKKQRVEPDDVVLALTGEFGGITKYRVQESETFKICETLLEKAKYVIDKPMLDRIIILDPLGGIPSEKRADGAHVFVNLEAEYKSVKEELRRRAIPQPPTETNSTHSVVGSSNPFSKFAESEVSSLNSSPTPQLSTGTIPSRHSRNLDVVQNSLKLLPSSSSALIICPAEAAESSQTQYLPGLSTGVRTRRSKNPLIHNLLTDKPMISSSLPSFPVHASLSSSSISGNHPTFLKKGIPVTIIPFPSVNGWQPVSPTNPSIQLESEPRINFPRLVELIEDSFRRKLDVHAYLSRIQHRIAGLIIAGDYEGAAICTWESPPSYPTSNIHVPYLDKFAVRTSSQGSGGVADIVWGALTRTCFPRGLVWRSRTSNPVNKWYFERAVGMYKLPGDEWTMFWTTGGVVEEWGAKQNSLRGRGEETADVGSDITRWDAYVDVCKGVVPTWADGKKPD